ncbi:hypothetical protein BD310DRAFT_904747 [Dichomitus squalens]|uniref:Uncharacterized protein n=1 Tax=Dichomitus squalens TaxID=114155 RepID=A0A4Q9Q370_9APHY|nr:hypothetical protein BD310DRAFT_904747 [Dichomitus squalens]
MANSGLTATSQPNSNVQRLNGVVVEIQDVRGTTMEFGNINSRPGVERQASQRLHRPGCEVESGIAEFARTLTTHPQLENIAPKPLQGREDLFDDLWRAELSERELSLTKYQTRSQNMLGDIQEAVSWLVRLNRTQISHEIVLGHQQESNVPETIAALTRIASVECTSGITDTASHATKGFP